MNEFFKRIAEQLKSFWTKWSVVQKIIFFAIVVVTVVGLVFLVSFSASPSMVRLINTPITDVQQRDNIIVSLTEQNVDSKITTDGYIMVPDESTAKKMRAILIRDGIITDATDPWALFDEDRWTLTDFERNVNLRRAIIGSMEQHIEALDDVDSAKITLVMPEKELFTDQQDPVTASVIITPRPGSDISENRKKVEGIVKLIQFGVQGLLPENITIMDYSGTVLNDFEGLEDATRLTIVERMLNQKKRLEAQYMSKILSSLRNIYSPERVEILNIEIDLEFINKQVETEEHFPITMREDDPNTPYSEYEGVPSILESSQTENELFEGTGFNPEGPPGQEGQTPPAYQDLSSLVGKYQKDNEIQNYVVNTRNISEDSNPFQISRISVAVAIDGIWKKKFDDGGKLVITPEGSIDRTYVPVSTEDLTISRDLVATAVGYNRGRGDEVTVSHIPFDRTSEHESEDAEYRRRQQIQQTVLFSLIGLAIFVVAAVVFRIISKELERRRRLREEELSRQHQAMREAALRSAEEEGIDVEMSVQERARIEMQENAINMAREHPEDVAQLIRTWLAEE
ncbi:flagellar basal-body MS-ring/collar protein FliF [Spirochaeta isovalerica]|uniref:Flagellar M-ring protein n=1 Tax=Spirochaeta isovalerica TaxID=150 RepID=A0A841RF02_9SPIO|nr:flagellar basal-body MS-ring/collar protein FliF [Spirochaeta isovalerica]MBB6481961.1 flagellar M-ring protein FliF [Spirochaeta isovalerica]